LNFPGRTLSIGNQAVPDSRLLVDRPDAGCQLSEEGEDMVRYSLLAVAVLLAPMGLAQDRDRLESSSPAMVIGPRNLDLHKGAELLLAGRTKDGVELTLRGLRSAEGKREEEAALSNLCSGYVVLERFDEALKYCELLLVRDDTSWRGYNNRALIYIMTEQYEKAHQDLVRAEELNPDAHTVRIARSIYLDAVVPVTTEIEIDDSKPVRLDERQQP
jgi:tetratricopeptide (TPR) repeat protein